MPPIRLALPLALLVLLVAAPPAAAADWGIEVVDFEFLPAEQRIAVGDTVIWSFADSGHTSTSVRGQPDSWNSAPGGTNPAGTAYRKRFDVPGRYQYVCTPHRTFMRGVVQVGTDAVADSIDRFRARRSGSRVRVSFTLNEPATLRYSVRGPSRRTVKRGRREAGDHAITVRRLRRGAYRGVLTVVDDFDKRAIQRHSFTVR